MDGNTKAWARSKHKQSERQSRRHGKGGRGRGRGGSAGGTASQHPPDYVDGSSDEGSDIESGETPQNVPAAGAARESGAPSATDRPKARGKYSRRQIASNHERYEEPEEEHEDSHRGADMRDLLAQAASTGAGAHMRLRGEAELDTDYTNAFEVDCVKLAAALKTLPLAIRLNLTTESAPYLAELSALDYSAGVKPLEVEQLVDLPLTSPFPALPLHSPVATSIASSPSHPPSTTAVAAPVQTLLKPAPPMKKEAQDLAELDALLASTKPSASPNFASPAPSAAVKPAAPTGATSSEKSLEDWLDSVI